MKLQLYYPVKPNTINQGFGVNGAYYQANGIDIIGHNGIDFHADHGQPVYASHDGTAYTEEDENQGLGVVLISDNQFDYGTGQAYFKSIYWHLLGPQLDIWGKKIKAGDLIGYADSTGFSSGDHLHFGLKPVANNEPAFTWINLEQNNGYLGCIDSTPYFNGLYAEDLNRFTFNVNMGYGSQNEEIRQLQIRLKKLGYFPLSQTVTGFYGPITARAVLMFQLDHKVDDLAALQSLGGKSTGPKTRAALNALSA